MTIDYKTVQNKSTQALNMISRSLKTRTDLTVLKNALGSRASQKCACQNRSLHMNKQKFEQTTKCIRYSAKVIYTAVTSYTVTQKLFFRGFLPTMFRTPAVPSKRHNARNPCVPLAQWPLKCSPGWDKGSRILVSRPLKKDLVFESHHSGPAFSKNLSKFLLDHLLVSPT